MFLVYKPLLSVACYVSLDWQIFPVLLLPRGQQNPHRGHLGQLLVGGLTQRVPLQVQSLKTGARHCLKLHVWEEKNWMKNNWSKIENQTCKKVFTGVEWFELRHLSQTWRQLDEGVGGDVNLLQLRAVGHLSGQRRDPVVGKIQLWKYLISKREVCAVTMEIGDLMLGKSQEIIDCVSDLIYKVSEFQFRLPSEGITECNL